MVHKKILEVIAQRKPSKAARLMREDILNVMQKLNPVVAKEPGYETRKSYTHKAFHDLMR